MVMKGRRIVQKRLDVVVSRRVDPKRLRSIAPLACQKQLLPMPEWNYFVACAVNDKNRRVDVTNAVNVWEHVAGQGKAEIKGHAIRRKQRTLQNDARTRRSFPGQLLR